MQILSLRGRRPLPAHEGRELAGLIVPVRSSHDLAPDIGVNLGIVEIGIHRDNPVDLRNQLTEHLDLPALLHPLEVTLAGFRAGDSLVALQQHRDHAHEFTMVGYDQEIEWSTNADSCLVIGMHDRVALRIAVGRIRIGRPVPHEVGVRRI